ncbi:hypothetical protein PBI_SCTP2_506 [Salicola phage SCTP-2]|nr:hypothetical protein PBI_SCTP2_506 [Salicola phage SCTP-2]
MTDTKVLTLNGSYTLDNQNLLFDRDKVRDGLKLTIEDTEYLLKNTMGALSQLYFNLVFPVINDDTNTELKSYCVSDENSYIYMKKSFENFYDDWYNHFYNDFLPDHVLKRIKRIKVTFNELQLGLSIPNNLVYQSGIDCLDDYINLQQIPISCSADVKTNFVINNKDLNRLKLDPYFYEHVYQHVTEIVDHNLVDLDANYIKHELYYNERVRYNE